MALIYQKVFLASVENPKTIRVNISVTVEQFGSSRMSSPCQRTECKNRVFRKNNLQVCSTCLNTIQTVQWYLNRLHTEVREATDAAKLKEIGLLSV